MSGFLVAAAAFGFALGYLVRRWHRPVGYQPSVDPALIITATGGTPYVSVSLRYTRRQPAHEIRGVLKDLRTQLLTAWAHDPTEPALSVARRSGVGTP